jgi:hypothetical protein
LDGVKYYIKTYEDFNKGKILMNVENLSTDSIKYSIQQKDIENKKIILNIQELTGLFDEESDFKSFSNTYIFIKESDLNTWIYTRTRLGLSNSEIITKISFDYSSYKDPFLYKDEYSNIYMIQNVIDFDFARAINVSYNWYLNKVNEGYESEQYILSSVSGTLKGYPRYVIYELSANGGIIATEDKSGGDTQYLKLFKYGIDKYASILPLL